MKSHAFLKTLGLTLSLVVGSSSAFAGAVGGKTCSDVFLPKAAASSSRAAVVTYLRSRPEVPYFMKSTPGGDIPVVLLNEVTYPLLRELLSTSVGYGVEARGETDHALMRLENTMVDLDHPGKRKGGELNENGLSWKELDQVLPWRRTTIQASYVMPKADREDVRYYHLVRRASLIRTIFYFTPPHEVNHEAPNLLVKPIENCMNYCKTDRSELMRSEIREKLEALLPRRVDQVMATHVVRAFVDEARAKLLATGAYDGANLNWKTILDVPSGSRLASLVKTEAELENLKNLIVADDALKRYQSVLSRYEITDDGGYGDMNRGVSSFVLVYAGMENAQAFREATYSATFAWFPWLNESQHPAR